MYMNYLLNSGQIESGLKIANDLVSSLGSHRSTTNAHYWLGLSKVKCSDRRMAINYLERIQNCLRGKPGYKWEQSIFIKSLILLERSGQPTSGIDFSIICPDVSLEEANISLQSDLELF